MPIKQEICMINLVYALIIIKIEEILELSKCNIQAQFGICTFKVQEKNFGLRKVYNIIIFVIFFYFT